MVFSYLWKTFRLVALVVLALIFVRTFIIEMGQVNGVSMYPTFSDNERFFVDKSRLLFTAPKRGAVIQIIEPETGKLLIKRVVGLPGETVTLKENRVWISDAAGTTYQLSEPYLTQNSITQAAPNKPNTFQLNEQEYFVLGDNRRESIDSRNYGPVARRHIIGLVLMSD